MAWTNSEVERRALVEAMRRRREPVRVICRRFGVSRAFAYRLLARCNEQGWKGVPLRRRGPKGWPRAQYLAYASWLRRFRRHRHWGGPKLRWRLRRRFPGRALPSIRTLEEWLHRLGLVHVRPRRRITPPAPLREAKRVR